MKNISIALSVLALVLIGVLFYLLSHHTDQLNKISETEKKTSGSDFRIAYFDMDSVEAHYNFFLDAQGQVKAKQDAMNLELSSLDKTNQKKMEVWRQKGNTITQAEAEQAQQEYQDLQQMFNGRKDQLSQELYKITDDLKINIRKRIEDFLKDYNKQKNYSFIFAYDPNSLMYYKDTVYNITPEIIKGLNDAYRKKN
jgi:outer membrane protein